MTGEQTTPPPRTTAPRGGDRASVALRLIWAGLALYVLSAYYLIFATAFGSRMAAILLLATPPVLLVSGVVVAGVGRRKALAWIFAVLLVLLVCAAGIVLAHKSPCYEPDGHYCAQTSGMPSIPALVSGSGGTRGAAGR